MSTEKELQQISTAKEMIANWKASYAYEIIEGLVWQFAFKGKDKKENKILHTAGLDILKTAFNYLNWNDPHIVTDEEAKKRGFLSKREDEKSKRERMKTECHSCSNKTELAYTHHISCLKPDLLMVGNEHGIKNGWFIYPFNFDPVWKETLCRNYGKKDNTD